jgi:hypothetical protein
MAVQKPLVIIGGQIQQIPSGDTLSAASSEVDVIAMTNANAGAITIGQPVYVSSAGSVNLAAAGAAGTRNVLGLVKDASIAAASSGFVQTDGIISSANWTVVVGSETLTAGSVYYLSATAGQLTTTAPTGSGSYVCKVGIAISTTELEIDTDRNGVLLA